MKNLRELFHALETHAQWVPSDIQETKVAAFIEALKDASVSEDQIRENLYPGRKSDSAFRELKRRVHLHLLNACLQWSLHYTFSHQHHQRLVELKQQLYLADFMHQLNYPEASAKIAMRCYKTAKSIHHYNYMQESLQIIRRYYSHREQVKKVLKCNQHIRLAMQKQRVEEFAVSKYEHILSLARTRSELDKQGLRLCKSYLLKLKKIPEKLTSPVFYIYYARLLNVYLDGGIHPDSEIRRLKNIWEKMGDFYLKNPQLMGPEQLTELSVNLARVYIFEREFDLGQKHLKYASIYLLDTNHDDWFRIKYTEILLLNWKGDLDESKKIMRSVMQSGRFSLLNEEMRQAWQLHDTYLQVISGEFRQASLQLPTLDDVFSFFRKDKKGSNVILYSLEIIWLLHQNNFEQALHKAESFHKYLRLHFLHAADKRLFHFSRLLENFIRNPGNPKSSLERKYKLLLEGEVQSFTSLRYEFVPLELVYQSIKENYQK